jgi:hypothetical protein
MKSKRSLREIENRITKLEAELKILKVDLVEKKSIELEKIKLKNAAREFKKLGRHTKNYILGKEVDPDGLNWAVERSSEFCSRFFNGSLDRARKWLVR